MSLEIICHLNSEQGIPLVALNFSGRKTVPSDQYK